MLKQEYVGRREGRTEGRKEEVLTFDLSQETCEVFETFESFSVLSSKLSSVLSLGEIWYSLGIHCLCKHFTVTALKRVAHMLTAHTEKSGLLDTKGFVTHCG